MRSQREKFFLNSLFFERSMIAIFEDFSLDDFVGRSFGVYQGEPVHIKV